MIPTRRRISSEGERHRLLSVVRHERGPLELLPLCVRPQVWGGQLTRDKYKFGCTLKPNLGNRHLQSGKRSGSLVPNRTGRRDGACIPKLKGAARSFMITSIVS